MTGTAPAGTTPGPGTGNGAGSRTWVVTVAYGREAHLERQRLSLAAGDGEHHHVLVLIGDHTHPSPEVPPAGGRVRGTDVLRLAGGPPDLPVAAARNLGAEHALRQGAEALVFLDVDCLAGRELVTAYGAACRSEPGTLWSGPVTYLAPDDADAAVRSPASFDDPHPARPAPAPGEVLHDAEPDLFWSLSFACHRAAWGRLGGFCEDYVGYGAEDTDLGALAVKRGLRLSWLGSARAYHQHHPVSRPPVEHVEAIVRNARIFHRRWGRWPMTGWLEEFERLGLVVRSETGQWRLA